jgi:acyl-CoA ligase (AMP-forming) (exosortase A-associated)
MRRIPYVVGHLLEDSVGQHEGRTAVKHKERSVTYGELYEDALRMKALLLRMGVKKGNRVGILLDKSIEQMVAMFGVSMSGGVFVFLNTILKKKQIEYIIGDCGIEVVITTSKLWSKNELTSPDRVVVMEETEEDFIVWPKVKQDLTPEVGIVGSLADDVACLIYTSGSTGLPKGVVVPHRTVVEGAQIVSEYLDITKEDRIISVLPLNFDYGLNQATSAVLHGACLVLHRFFLANDLLRVLVEERITGFAGMTPIWTKLFHERSQAKDRYAFPHLRYITNSGGKVPRSIVAKLREAFPNTRIYLMYGLTEAFRSTYLPPEEIDRRPDSIGKAIPNVEILVVNERGEVCPPGVPGELVHRGALITRGYWNDPASTERVFRRNPLLGEQEHLNEIVVYSGDLAKTDEEGFLYFISRKDEMIKRSGFRISPTEVEEVLVEIPGVGNAVVFGKEIEDGEQGVVAVIECGATAIEAGWFLQECRKRLPAYMVPYAVHFERTFEKTANGKIDRSFLKKKWAGVGEQDAAC